MRANSWWTIAVVLASTSTAGAFDEDRVHVIGGIVEGSAGPDGVRAFQGIPFAAPPGGHLRWRPPQPVTPWDGVKKVRAFAAAPIQNPGLTGMMRAPAHFSEDCLYLNVWTPARGADERRTVMVWIHGGAFAMGATSAPIYDGTRLAEKGVIVVSVAYRVGPLGFLAHPELSREAGASGKYGPRDQIAGLRWVRDNIAAFGVSAVAERSYLGRAEYPIAAELALQECL
jgi:para-nitrobenzyl esterase